MVEDANTLEERCKFLVFSPPPSPVCLASQDLSIKETFYKLLEIMKFTKHIRFVFQEIEPCELAKIINERHIVSKVSNRGGGKTSNIREHKL
jgi:hypothetical protein